MTISVLFLTQFPIENPRHGGTIRSRAIYDTYVAMGATVKNVLPYKAGYSMQIEGKDKSSLSFSNNTKFSQGTVVPFISDYLVSLYATSDAVYEVVKACLPSKVDLIHVEFPWSFNLALRLLQEEPCRFAKLVYSSQNIEAPLKRELLTHNNVKNADFLMSKVEAVEIDAMRNADFVLAVTGADAKIISRYTKNPVFIAPNGISPWSAKEEKIAYWKENLPSVPWPLFVGSAFHPNFKGFIDCFGDSLDFMPPKSKIVVAGNVGPCLYEYYKTHPLNEINLPKFSTYSDLADDDLAAIKDLASIYVLPITYGGGSNIKTAEAIYSGKPIVGTTLSFRGFEAYLTLPGIHIVDDPQMFRQKVNELLLCESKIVDTPEQSLLRQQVTWQNCLTSSIQTILDSIA